MKNNIIDKIDNFFKDEDINENKEIK